jgi:hypothetical protein
MSFHTAKVESAPSALARSADAGPRVFGPTQAGGVRQKFDPAPALDEPAGVRSPGV